MAGGCGYGESVTCNWWFGGFRDGRRGKALGGIELYLLTGDWLGMGGWVDRPDGLMVVLRMK